MADRSTRRHASPGAARDLSVRLWGRETELDRLGGLLDEVPTDRAAVLVVRGDAGQGKTVLLDRVAADARDRGFETLRATGVEFERGLPFSGLTAVLRPLLPRLDELTAAQAASLRGALGLAPASATALTVYGATLSLLSLGAETSPVLVGVDDAHWVDAASLEALVFAAHRCDADRVGFVFTQRSGHTTALDQGRFARVELEGLDRGAAVDLLGDEDVAPAVAARCWRLTNGNPLALLEGARGLSPAQRQGEAPLPPVLPVDDRLLDDYRSRLAVLPRATLRALGIAALAPNDDAGTITSALARLGGRSDDLDIAERAGVVTLARGRVRWRHPLLRCAAHSALVADERRDLHRVLADVASAAGHADVAVWHMAESVTGPDAGVADRLAATGQTAYGRGALAAAAEAYEQAARLAGSTAERDRHLLRAADVRWAGGDFERAAALLRGAVERTDDPVTRAEMALVLGQTEVWLTGAHRSARQLEDQARAVADLNPGLSAVLLLRASVSWLMTLDLDGALHTAEAAVAIADRTDDPAAVFGTHAIAALCRFFAGGGPASEAAIEPIAQMALATLDVTDEKGATPIVMLCAYAQITRGEVDAAIELLDRVVDSDAARALGRTVLAQMLRADALWRSGRWAYSLAEMSHLLSLEDAYGRRQVRLCAAAVLSRIAAGLGQEDVCRLYADEVLSIATPLGTTYFATWALSSLGLLDLAAGRHPEAADHFDQVTAIAGHLREPGVVWWQADAIEAYHGCGRIDDAGEALSRLEAQATTTGRRWALAAAARSAALVRGDDPEAALTTALDGFRALRAPFEEGRTLLARAEHHLRVGCRRESKRDAAAARTIFDQLGARVWSERAAALRGDAGGAPTSLAARLTPAELRVALAVGQGASSREAAAALYISSKTVNYHVQNIYRKLGVHRRTQLAALVATDRTGLDAATR
jgi:DNA-binding CsgD family transcriptional regulator